jgi:AcrR family transcriptional regulator
VATQQERRERTVAAIVTAARPLVAERGYATVTVDDIATAAGVAKGAFYHHFSSKQALLDHLVDQTQHEIAVGMGARPRLGPPTAADLAAALELYLRAASRPDRRRVLLVDGPEVLGWDRWRQIDDHHFAGMTRAAITAIVPPGTAADRIDAATRLVLGAVMEAALDTGRAPDPDAAATQYGKVLRALVDGLRQLG